MREYVVNSLYDIASDYHCNDGMYLQSYINSNNPEIYYNTDNEYIPLYVKSSYRSEYYNSLRYAIDFPIVKYLSIWDYISKFKKFTGYSDLPIHELTNNVKHPFQKNYSFENYLKGGGNPVYFKNLDSRKYIITRGIVIDGDTKEILLCVCCNRDYLKNFILCDFYDEYSKNFRIYINESLYNHEHRELFFHIYTYIEDIVRLGVEKFIVDELEIFSNIFNTPDELENRPRNIDSIKDYLSKVDKLMSMNLDHYNEDYIEEFIVNRELEIIDDIKELEIIDDVNNE